MAGIFGILESPATQWYQDVAPTELFLSHGHIYSLCCMQGIVQETWLRQVDAIVVVDIIVLVTRCQ